MQKTLTMRYPALMRCLFAVALLSLNHIVLVYAADVDLEVNTGASYDSNISRSGIAPKEDAYFTLAPRFALKMPLSKSYFSSDVRAALEQHISESEANLQELVFSGMGRYSPSNNLSFGLSDQVILSGRLQSAEKLTDMATMREFFDNRLTSTLKYELEGDIIASLDYTNIIRDYRNTEIDDWAANVFQSRIEYHFGHKTSTQIHFGMIAKKYKMGMKYTGIPVMVSFKRQLSSKFETTFSLGLESRGYKEEYYSDKWNNLIMELNVTGKHTPRTTSKLSLQRKIYDSDLITGYTFLSKAGSAEVNFSLNEMTSITLSGLYGRKDYIQSERSDEVFGMSGAIRYSFSKWGAVVLSYSRERRISNVLSSDYGQHVVDLSYVALF